MVKNPPANVGHVGDLGSIPGLGRSSGVGGGMVTHSSIPAWKSHGQRTLAGSSPQRSRVGYD